MTHTTLKTVLATALFGAFVTLAGSAPAEAGCQKINGNRVCAPAAQVRKLLKRGKLKGFRVTNWRTFRKARCRAGSARWRNGRWQKCAHSRRR